MRFASGSTATISYVTVGNSRFPKETLDAAAGGAVPGWTTSAEAAVWSGRKRSATKARGGQDKGQRHQLERFVEAVRTGAPMPIALDSLVATTTATIAVADSLASGTPEQV